MLDSGKDSLNISDTTNAKKAFTSFAIPSVVLSLLCIMGTYALDNQATVVAVIGGFSTILGVGAGHLINLYRLYKTDNNFKTAVDTVIEKIEEEEAKTNTSINP